MGTTAYSKRLRTTAIMAGAVFCLGGNIACAGMGSAWEDLAQAKSKANSNTGTPTGGTASQLVLTGPTSFANYGTCDGPYTIQAQDASGAAVSLSSDLTINLTTSSGSGGFYPAGCGAAITQITISAGASSASLYYRETCTPGTHTLTASSVVGSGSLNITYGGGGC